MAGQQNFKEARAAAEVHRACESSARARGLTPASMDRHRLRAQILTRDSVVQQLAEEENFQEQCSQVFPMKRIRTSESAHSDLADNSDIESSAFSWRSGRTTSTSSVRSSEMGRWRSRSRPSDHWVHNSAPIRPLEELLH